MENKLKVELSSAEIVSIRKQYNLSQQLFSTVLGWSKATIVRYETNKNKPGASHLAILQALQAQPSLLIGHMERNWHKLAEKEKSKLQEVSNQLAVASTQSKPFEVLVIGGANIDLQGFPNGKLNLRDSNPGQLKMSLGGVGRNIADNLARLGVATKMITALGGDVYAQKIINGAKEIGLDLTDACILPEEATSTYLSILDENGDMALALSDMSIIDKLTMDFIQTKAKHICSSKLTILDTNLSAEVLDQVSSSFVDMPFLLDTVSVTKAEKVRNFIGRFHTIKPNRVECEMLTGISIKTHDDLLRAEERFLTLGVQRVFITLGADGVFYSNGKTNGCISGLTRKVVNATGAGDAFVAGLAYGHVTGMTIADTAHFAQAAAALALSHENTINPHMTVANVKELLKKAIE